jgi:hypothetical protein
MIISEVTLQGFRCFGPIPTTVGLDGGLTVFIGDNGSGKTALMLALLRVLGPGRQSIVRQDFHVPPTDVDAPSKRTLSIELKLIFPELAEDGTDLRAVPEFFNQMTVDEDGAPVCRLRLDATWVNDGTHDGGSTNSTMWYCRQIRAPATTRSCCGSAPRTAPICAWSMCRPYGTAHHT